MASHIYCHIPFCAAKCPYCDFYSESGRSNGTITKVIDAMISEVLSISPDEVINTIYIGGGTPSFIPAEQIAKLVNAIKDHFEVAIDAEITIEVNPVSLTSAKAAIYRAAGINRVSVGVQSLHDEHLKTLGRLHDSKGAVECLETLKEAGFTNISADLIIAVPGQTTDDVIEDMIRLKDLGAKHISTYSLSIEEGTPFEKLYGDSIEDLVPPSEERAMYHELRDSLVEAGFIPYEISSSCLPGYESRHNSSYWEGEEYYGIGPGSHGYINSRRYMHEDSIDKYINDPLYNVTEEELSEDDKIHEYPYLKLRTTAGMDAEEFRARFGKDLMDVFGEAIRKNMNDGLLEQIGNRFSLTKQGIDWCNKVASDFI